MSVESTTFSHKIKVGSAFGEELSLEGFIPISAKSRKRLKILIPNLLKRRQKRNLAPAMAI